jgi:SAM-dependent methyltransferase
MAKAIKNDYSDELRQQSEAWQRKPALRAVYHSWYQRILYELADDRPVVEIGAGCGNFKRFFPDAVATDVIQTGQWIDQMVDARQLPFGAGTIGNFVLIDCLHHLPRPISFIRNAIGALRPGGRIVLLEPAANLWSRIVWRLCHHEPVDLTADFFGDQDRAEPENPGFTYANMATGHILFGRDASRLEQAVPGCRVVKVQWSDALLYPATGGFSYVSLLPSRWIEAAHPWELRLTPKWLARRVGLRMLIVVEKLG